LLDTESADTDEKIRSRVRKARRLGTYEGVQEQTEPDQDTVKHYRIDRVALENSEREHGLLPVIFLPS